MENNTESTELEQMRAQLNLLKGKLEKETIVNERLIRKAMKEKVSSLNRQTLVLAFIILLAIPYCTWVFTKMLNASWWFIAVTDLFFLVAVIYTYVTHKDLRAKELIDGNLVDVSRKITRMQRLGANWLKFSIPFGILWFAWFLFEVLGRNFDNNPSFSIGVAIGGLVGGIIGGWFGFMFYRRKRKKLLEVIMQIKELSEAS